MLLLRLEGVGRLGRMGVVVVGGKEEVEVDGEEEAAVEVEMPLGMAVLVVALVLVVPVVMVLPALRVPLVVTEVMETPVWMVRRQSSATPGRLHLWRST